MTPENINWGNVADEVYDLLQSMLVEQRSLNELIDTQNKLLERAIGEAGILCVDTRYEYEPTPEEAFSTVMPKNASINPDARILDFVDAIVRWNAIDHKYLMRWLGGLDEEGRAFCYSVSWDVDADRFEFCKDYWNGSCRIECSAEEKLTIIVKMMELIYQHDPKN